MPFHVCYYHIVWATKNREPLITPQIEACIFTAVHHKCDEMKSPIHALNTADDHIHIAVSIPPSLSVAQWVKHVKGLSTHEINTRFPNLPVSFGWQSSYGVLTFGAKVLPFIIDYINKQKEHHLNNTLEPYLEQTDAP